MPTEDNNTEYNTYEPPRITVTGGAGGAVRTLKEIILYVALFMVLKTSVVSAYKIPSASMEDTLLVGDFLLCNQFLYGARLPLTDWRLPAIREPRAGDVVVFYFPSDGVTRYIKRCVAVGGDTVEVTGKKLFVNGVEIPDPPGGKYIDTSSNGLQRIQSRRDNFGPYIVPMDSYFMMGDNRDNSYDSRFWGTVPGDLVVGKAIMIHWSWNDDASPSPEVTWKDPLSVPRLFVHETIHFFDKVRFGRVFNAL